MKVTVRLTLGPNGIGRGRSLRSGMRPNWRLTTDGDAPGVHDGTVTIVGANELEPGATGLLEVEPLFPTEWQRAVGERVELRTGARVLGSGTVETITR